MSRDLAQISAALKRHLVSGHKITNIKAISTGNSNETYFIEGLDLILRLMPEGEPLTGGYGIKEQFEIYSVLQGAATAPPVPSVRYLCLDDAVLGEPFYLMQKVEGISFDEYTDKSWFVAESDAFRESVMRQYVASIANLSSLEVLEVLGPVRSCVDDCRVWRHYGELAGEQELVEVLDKLIACAPQLLGDPSPAHGDAKLANTIWLDGKLQALLDWEMAYNGDPRSDLGYMTFFLRSAKGAESQFGTASGVWLRDRVIAEWEAISGREAKQIEWFEALSAAKIAAITLYGGYLYRSNQTANEKMVAWSSDEFRQGMVGMIKDIADQA